MKAVPGTKATGELKKVKRHSLKRPANEGLNTPPKK